MKSRVFLATAVGQIALMASSAFGQTTTPTLKVSIPAGSRYSMKTVDGFAGEVTSDGKYHSRVIVTMTVLAPPDSLVNSSPSSEIIEESGLLGSALRVSAIKEKIKRQITTLVKDDSASSQTPELFDADYLRSAINGDIIDFTKSFSYQDWIYNANSLGILISKGPDLINLAGTKSDLQKSKGKLQLLRDPKDAKLPNPSFASGLDPLDFQNFGRWYFDVYDVAENKLGNVKHLVGVRIEWALDVSFDASKKVSFPIAGSVSFNNPPTTNGSKSTTPAAQNLVADFTPITGLPVISDVPGIDPVVGAVVTNNGPAGLAGFNVRWNNFRRGLGTFSQYDRYGVLLGFTDNSSSKRQTVLSGSYYLNDNAMLFGGLVIGGAFRSVNNSARQSPAFGLVFRFSVRGVTADAKDKSQQATEAIKPGPAPMEIANAARYQDFSYIERSAGIWFVGEVDPKLTVNFKAIDDATIYPYESQPENFKYFSVTSPPTKNPLLITLPSGTLFGINSDSSLVNRVTKIEEISSGGTITLLFGDATHSIPKSFVLEKGKLYRITVKKIS